MDRDSFDEKCLQTHRDLLEVERSVHEWLTELTGVEVATRPSRADRPETERPPAPAHKQENADAWAET